jgi:hypothetical protein
VYSARGHVALDLHSFYGDQSKSPRPWPYRCLIMDVASFPNRFCISFYFILAVTFHPLAKSAA